MRGLGRGTSPARCAHPHRHGRAPRAADRFGHSQRILDQRLSGGPGQLLDPGVQRLRHARDDVETSVRSAWPWIARTGHLERAPRGTRRTRFALGVRDERTTGHPLRATHLVRPGPPSRLPLRPPTLGRPPRRPARPDQERPRQQGLPKTRPRSSGSLATPPDLRHPRGDENRPADRLLGQGEEAVLLEQRPQLHPHVQGPGDGGGREPPCGDDPEEQPVHPGAVGAGEAERELCGVGQRWGEAGEGGGRGPVARASTIVRATTRFAVPCPNGAGAITVETTSMSEGTQALVRGRNRCRGQRRRDGADSRSCRQHRARCSRGRPRRRRWRGGTQTTSI